MVNVIPMITTKKIFIEYTQEKIKECDHHCKKQLSTKEDNHAGNEGQKCFKVYNIHRK